MRFIILAILILTNCLKLDDLNKPSALNYLSSLVTVNLKSLNSKLTNEATFQIQGTLKDSNGNPIANAILTLGVSQNVISKESITTSTFTDSIGNYTLNLRIGNFSIKVINSTGTEIGSFSLKANSTTSKPDVITTSGSLIVIVNSISIPGPIVIDTNSYPSISRNWAKFTDLLNGTIRLDIREGIFGGQSYNIRTVYFAKCTYGQIYNSSLNSCSGNGITSQFCNSADNSCNSGNSNLPLSNGPIFNICNGYSIGGRNGWRVPTKNELKLLNECISPSDLPNDNSQCSTSNNPTINSLFPNSYGAEYWTSTTYIPNNIYAWYVGFSDGRNGPYDSKTANLYLRCISD